MPGIDACDPDGWDAEDCAPEGWAVGVLLVPVVGVAPSPGESADIMPGTDACPTDGCDPDG